MTSTEEMDAYVLGHIDEESALLASLNRDAHVRLLRPRMIAGHLQGRLLKMFCRMIRPGRLLEIGTYTSYATLCMAEGLDDGALIHSVEINDEMEPFVRPYLEQSPDRDKIRIHWGDVADILPRLDEIFDMVYIDADKRDYCAYYAQVFPYVRPGGYILADNTLWSGKVVEEDIAASDRHTQGIRDFNEMVKNDRRVEKVIIPVRDGLTVIYKCVTRQQNSKGAIMNEISNINFNLQNIKTNFKAQKEPDTDKLISQTIKKLAERVEREVAEYGNFSVVSEMFTNKDDNLRIGDVKILCRPSYSKDIPKVRVLELECSTPQNLSTSTSIIAMEEKDKILGILSDNQGTLKEQIKKLIKKAAESLEENDFA
jgi:predicted O-methyltransferase YrrM